MKAKLLAQGVKWLALLGYAALLIGAAPGRAVGQREEARAGRGDGDEGERAHRMERGSVRSITIPVTVRWRDGVANNTETQTLDLVVQEDGEPQEILSARGVERAPLALSVLVQDDVMSSIGNEIAGLGQFIRGLPAGTRVQVAYLRSGSMQVRQRFTTDLERAAKALRVPVGSAFAAPYNPYTQLVDALKRYESQPTGRRAVLVISDGLDVSRGVDGSSPGQSTDLQRAINEAQRRGVAIYSIYVPTNLTSGNFILSGNGQGSLARLSAETGGRAFFQGTNVPVSFDPFLRELQARLSRQFALTYLSTHTGKEFHRIKIQAPDAQVELTYPAGYMPK